MHRVVINCMYVLKIIILYYIASNKKIMLAQKISNINQLIIIFIKIDFDLCKNCRRALISSMINNLLVWQLIIIITYLSCYSFSLEIKVKSSETTHRYNFDFVH